MRPAKKAAVCGIVTALSVVLMFCTGIFPFASYAIPGLCGALLLVIVIEMGRKQALLVYIAVSLLALFLTPDRSAAAAYIILLGHYAIVKSLLEQMHNRVLEWLCKIGVFILAIAVLGLAAVLLSGWKAVVGMGPLLMGGSALFALATCLLYDWCLTLIVQLYHEKIRPHYIGRFFR